MSPSLLLLLSLSACKDKGATPVDSGGGGDDGTSTTDPFEGVEVDETWEIPGMRCDATVIRTAASVPHIYAHDREDLARVYGFVQARDRYFEMDLARRLGQGRLSEILGADALETDMESRSNGMTWVADNLLENLTDEQAAIMDAFAEGVNAYLAQVRADELPLASELEIAGPFLGVSDPKDLLTDWDRRDLAGVAAVLVYELGYETDDVGRTADLARLAGLFDGKALGELRQAGIEQDVWGRVDPVLPSYSAHDWSWGGSAVARSPSDLPARLFAPIDLDMLDRLAGRLDRFEDRLGRGDLEAGWGSNVWAVGGAVSADGTAMLAGDGHLPLSVPSLFWQVGLDTSVLGGGDTHQLGLGIPGLPVLAVGTNGSVAWSQTQLMGDITDWYREELVLDAAGAPSATIFEGGEQPVATFTESHEIADVPLLGSEGGTFTWARYTTFDGRWIADIEGTVVPFDHT
ncbi:MAG: penicillin acylase family protein, partial [Alphaproteobacteria bacterium]|nr:penicillin acylase family protein [Alphaproteobacteria bacterium]